MWVCEWVSEWPSRSLTCYAAKNTYYFERVFFIIKKWALIFWYGETLPWWKGVSSPYNPSYDLAYDYCLSNPTPPSLSTLQYMIEDQCYVNPWHYCNVLHIIPPMVHIVRSQIIWNNYFIINLTRASFESASWTPEIWDLYLLGHHMNGCDRIFV